MRFYLFEDIPVFGFLLGSHSIVSRILFALVRHLLVTGFNSSLPSDACRTTLGFFQPIPTYSTYSNLHTQFRTYFAFCVFFERDPLPVDSETVYAYAQFLSRSLKPPTVRNYLSGVKMLHILLGLPYPHSEDFLLKLELRGLARLHPHVPVRAKPVTPEILLMFYHHMHHTSSLHCSVWSCCLLLFYTMARLGSILPSSLSTPRHEFLTHDRINFCEEGLLVTLVHTKTIQFGRRRLHIPRSEQIRCSVLSGPLHAHRVSSRSSSTFLLSCSWRMVS